MATPEPDFLATHHFPPSTTPQDVLKIVWDKFYHWDGRACRALLDDLRSEQPSRNGPSELENALGSITPYGAQPDDVANEFFAVLDYDENGDQLEETGLLAVSIVEDEPSSTWTVNHWKPNPRYMACTPLSANIYVPHEGPPNCSFPPFSDDPTFNLAPFLALYSRFAWQWDFKDPDYEMIHLETTRILHYHPHFQLTFEEIDDLNLPSLPKIRRTADSGLVWESYQRDPLLWTDYVVSLDRGEVLSLDFVAACYSNLNYLHWQDSEDLEMLRNILKLSPDALPCDLAVICRKPCDQVFANRKSLFPDEDILEERCTDPPIRFPITHFADVKDANYKAWAT
ncbi:hypothetical protein EST38_g1608 [Candolleomyces aberdarensis]|uniref:Uncharacterized protein n=1 Tax=Candolleomyces aberdarensis TaxID=2316362 RepID=A0A4Q2DV18_9AGAR|nr:hypothetical protein EST38_g1608 [Candolleomyces aberdarensis]